MWAITLYQCLQVAYNPARDEFRAGCHALGITPADEPATIEEAYDLQIACDASSLPRHLEALDTLARAPFPGKERLQMKVATERSLDRYTSGDSFAPSRVARSWQPAGDIQAAYARIGFTQEQVDLIGVEAAEAPESYILDLHKKAVQASSSPAERPEIAQALTLIGRERNSEVMRRLGRSGQTHLSVDEAYAALSAPRNSIDDGLIMWANFTSDASTSW
jgi:ubiquitin carboxyl-terminal hydrolase 25/28